MVKGQRLIWTLSVNLVMWLVAVAVSAQPVEINWLHWEAAGKGETYDRLIEAFHSRQDEIRVVRQAIAGVNATYERLAVQTAAGLAPDIVEIGEVAVANLYGKGLIRAVDPFVERSGVDRNDFWESGLRWASWDGKLLAFPMYTGPWVYYYNVDLFDQSGVAPPISSPTDDWTVDEFMDVSRRLTKVDNDGNPVQWAVVHQRGTGALSWVYSFGNDIMNEDRTRFLLDQPDALEAFDFLDQLHHGLKLAMPTGMSGLRAFNEGMVAMRNSGRFAVRDFVDPQTGGFVVNWGVAPPPIVRRFASPNVGVALGIASASRHPEAAWEFIKFVVSTPEGQSIMTGDGRGIPILKSQAAEIDWLLPTESAENVQIFGNTLARSFELPYHPEWAETMSAYFTGGSALNAFWNQEVSAVEAVTQATELANQVLANSDLR